MRAFLNRWILSLTFLGILATPLLWFGHPGFVPAAAQENRRPTPFPKRSLFWLQQIEKWFNDRFGLRATLVYYGSRLQLAKTGGHPLDQRVVLGKNGWLFFDELYAPGHRHFAELSGQAPFSSAELRTIAHHLQQVRRALDKCAIPFYFVVAPDKQSIYPDQLPQALPAGPARTDQLIGYLNNFDPKLAIVDLRPALRAARATSTFELYRRTDTHWNSLGAYWAYRALRQRWRQDGIVLAPPVLELSDFELERIPDAGGDIAVNLLSLPGYFKDEHFTLRPRAGFSWNSVPQGAQDSADPHPVPTAPTGQPQAELAAPAALTESRGRTPPQPGTPAQATAPGSLEDISRIQEYVRSGVPGRLLLYRDSFATLLLPFLAQDVGKLEAIWQHQPDGQEIRAFRPTLVIWEALERYLQDLRDPPRDLDSLCETPRASSKGRF